MSVDFYIFCKILNVALALPFLALKSSSVPPLVLTVLPCRYVNNETLLMAPFSNIMGLLLVVFNLMDFVLSLYHERPSFPADSSIWAWWSSHAFDCSYALVKQHHRQSSNHPTGSIASMH